MTEARAEQIQSAILSVVRTWSAEEGECRPSQVCSIIAESGLATYHECADQLAVLLKSKQLVLDPNIPRPQEIVVKFGPGKPGLYIP